MESEQQTKVLLIEGNAEDARSLQAVLAGAGGEFQVCPATLLSEGLSRLAQGGIDIVLLNPSLPDAQGQEAFSRTFSEAKGVPVILISSQDDATLALRAVREGAQDYLVKGRLSGPSLVRCLRYAVERHQHMARLLREAQRQEGGKVLSFVGVRGGSGVTTLALNIAAALGQTGAKTVALELGSFSNFALQLRKTAHADTGQLLEMEPRDVDGDAVNRRLVSLPHGFRALFAPQKGTLVRDIGPDHVTAIVRGAAALSEFSVVDLPAQLSRAHEAVMRVSSFVAIVLEPEPLAVELGKLALQTILSLGIDSSALGLVVVNRLPLTNSIRLPEIRNQVGCEILGSVPPAAEACVLAVDAAKPLVLLQPEVRYSLAVKEITHSLAQTPVPMLRM